MSSAAAPVTMTATATGKLSRDLRSAARTVASALTGCGQGLERSVPVGREAEIGEEARHDDALTEVAEPGLGMLAARECERELRITPARGERQWEAAAETRVDVG